MDCTKGVKGISKAHHVHPLPFAVNAVLLIVGGLLLGAVGSGLTLRRFLQV